MSDDTPTLRLARLADAEAISSMTSEYIEAGLKARYSPLRIGRLIADRETIVLVADGDARPAGFSVMSFGEERAHLALIAVRPGRRRAGVGRSMMDWLTESALTAGIASIHLELRADNAPALRFYQRLGFSETVVVPGYYDGRIDALRMVRVLRVPQKQV
jgi:ribosomal-protein-alanine N-acetyltransferase